MDATEPATYEERAAIVEALEACPGEGPDVDLFGHHKEGNMNADQIAKNLNLVAKDYIEGRISMEVHSQVNRALWDLARGLGLEGEVGNILNQSVVDEMSETEAQLKGS